MKRGWTKKVKAVPTCVASNDALQGHCKPGQPKLKRRVRTSVAMVGLVISMGAPNLLLTRQSDRTPAAEAIDNEPTTASSAPVTTTEAAKNESTNLGEPKAVPVPVSVAALSSEVESSIQPVQPKAEVLPVPVIESVQKEPSSRQDQNYQVEKANSETYAARVNQQRGEVAGGKVINGLTKPKAIALEEKVGIPAYNNPQPPAIQAEKLVRIQRENRLVQKLKAGQIERLSQSAELQRTEITQTPAIVVTQPLLAKSVTVNDEVNAKQKALINRLKQASNRSEDSLQLNAQSNPSFIITPLAQPNTTLASPSRNEASVNSIVVDTVEQQNVAVRSPIVVKSNEDRVLGLQQSPATPAPTVGSLEVPDLKAPTPTAASINPVVVGIGQQNVAQPSLAPTNRENPEFDLQQSPAIPEAIVESELPLETPTSNEATVSPTLESNAEVQDLAPPLDVTSNENTVPEDKYLETTPETVGNVPAIQDARKELIAVVAPSQEYQVKAGDTLSAIARKHGIQISELIETNRLSNPNLIEINQQIKIPTLQASNGVSQTITIINRPPQSKTTASASNIESVFVIPPVASADNSSAAYTGMGGSISDDAEQLATPTAYTGMGGSISDDAEQVATPVDYEKVTSTSYPQDLQTDIQKLRQKYYAQHRDGQLVPVVNETSTVSTSVQVSARGTATIGSQKISPQVRPHKLANQPINPEFRVAQVSTSQPKTKARVATAASSLDASESIQSLRGRQVSPELPPLGGVDTYLPKPNSTPLKGYIWPAKGVLTSGYGWRWGRMHKGIDIAAPIGTPIMAAAPGVVVKAGWNSGGYGNLVDVLHADGSFTRYGHNKRILVRAGQQVGQGQQISEMGSTGFSTGPHLHFEVHPGGKSAVNPIAFLPKRVSSRK